jgi:hypothetical protein
MKTNEIIIILFTAAWFYLGYLGFKIAKRGGYSGVAGFFIVIIGNFLGLLFLILRNKFSKKMASIKQDKVDKQESNTKKIISLLNKNSLPDFNLIQASNFNKNNEYWSKYLELYEAEEEKKLALKQQQRKLENDKEDILIKKYGKRNYDKAKKGELFIDMDEELLIIAKGQANKIEERVVNKVKKYKWFYGKYETNRGTINYKFEVSLEGKKVIGWKNI